MKDVKGLAMRVAPWVAPVLVGGIFVLDLLTPLSWADWVLYFIPLVLLLKTPNKKTPYLFAVVVTGLVLFAAYFHKDVDPYVAFFNRCLGVLGIWVIAWLIAQQRSAQTRLAGATAAQSQAESDREAAVVARQLAEASAMGAIHRESETARELLIKSHRLENILQSAMDAIVTVDERQQIILFNEAAEHMFCCSVAEAIGQSLDKFIPVRFREAHRRHVETFGRSGITSRRMTALSAVTGLRSDGEEFPIEAAISQITVEGKKFYTVILRDVTERKRADELLEQSEERYRRLIEVSPLAIFVHRGERIVFVNQQGLALLGASKVEDVIGRSPLDFVHPVHVEQSRHRAHRIMHEEEQVSPAEERFVRMDGTEVDVEVAAARFVDAEGVGVEVVVRDVTERKRLQDQLKRAERLAELGTLASGMAHEIGTPMNVILGRAEYLMERIKEEPIRKGLQTIVNQVERITRVMNQLLAFARRKPVERHSLDLRQTIEGNLDMFEERLKRSGIKVEMSFLSSCSAIHADADQMSQVVINLVMNAIHAMPDGGTLRIGLEPVEDMVRLTVADTGQGIPQEVVTKIFEPFFTTKEFGKGTGLGLTVVKDIIEEHHGTIAVESEPGRGTTFTIQLPLSETGQG